MICINDIEAVMKAMSHVEGAGWRSMIGANLRWDRVRSFRKAWLFYRDCVERDCWCLDWARGCTHRAGYIEPLDEDGVPREREDFTIYGLGGWNRYFVLKSTGEVVFSEAHASHPESIKLAEQAGLRIV